MSAPFTLEQEARVREIVREEREADGRRAWEAWHARLDAARSLCTACLRKAIAA